VCSVAIIHPLYFADENEAKNCTANAVTIKVLRGGCIFLQALFWIQFQATTFLFWEVTPPILIDFETGFVLFICTVFEKASKSM
jgi:hypothetical protein